ncbi:transposase [Streptomyces sp. DSM 41524]|uniref:Transposase n=1 Tax=Streptomyces asiaticus subsp. ignotus TaxID=3098222 RepID=A0ABU7QBQ1_9ACTN|nr:transposase [Streptomyces sp. DSM 41524]
MGAGGDVDRGSGRRADRGRGGARGPSDSIPTGDLINGVRWRTRTGAPWRDAPERCGPWDRVYDLFRRWQRDGTWARILTCLRPRRTRRA